MTLTRWIILVVGLLFLTLALTGLHHYLTRPDRVRADELYRELCSVRDQIIEYEYETGSLPDQLESLVPHHLREDQITSDGIARFKYSPERRWIEEAQGPEIRGLVSRRMPARGIDLPKPDRPTASLTPEVVAMPPQSPAETVVKPPLQPVKVTPETPAVAEIKRVTPVEPATDIKAEPKRDPNVTASAPVDTKVPVMPPPPEPVASRQDTPEPLLLNDALLVPKQAEGALEPPSGAIVFEAELYTQTNYGWEVHADSGANGGAFLHCKEGIANGPAQSRGVGNFHQTHSNSDVTMLRYHINVPRSGTYYCYGRMFTTDTHCSNYVCAAFDKGGPYIGGMGNTTPFRWVWSPIKNGDSEGPIQLTKGDHFLHLFIHEDGVRVDQFILSPSPIEGGARFKANLVPGRGTSFEKETGPCVHTHLDYPTMVLSPDWKTEANVVIRRLRAPAGKNAEKDARAKFKAVLQGAGANGTDLLLADGELDLAALPEIAFLPLSFDKLDVKNLRRREYMLKADLTQPDGTVVSCETPLMRPFQYEFFGPGKFLSIDQTGPLDADGEAKPNDERKWEPFADKNIQIFGVLDFGMQTTGNSLHPMQHTCCYARTNIHVPKTATYLFKMQSDDQMILWIDGKEVFRYGDSNPVTRTALRLKLRLEEGDHRLRMRVNQLEGRWQAVLRIRTEDDGLSDVTGVEPDAKK